MKFKIEFAGSFHPVPFVFEDASTGWDFLGLLVEHCNQEVLVTFTKNEEKDEDGDTI